MRFRQLVSIHGVPRSGTSWLGQIFDKHSDVRYRFQPLFAYRFRGRLNSDSSPEEILEFLDDLYQVEDDDFIAGKWPKQENAAAFPKRNQPRVMVMKEVRYHYLIESFIRAVPDVKILGIVRHPCAVISSWVKNPREFKGEWDPLSEWRRAPSKNQGRPEEYFGYEKWREVATTFLDFQTRYPDNFLLIRYEQLVLDAVETIRAVFDFAGLEMEPQVIDFIKASQSYHLNDPYAVYKSPTVRDRWRSELDPRISEAIMADLKGTALERFLA